MQKQGPKPRDTSCSPNMPKLASLNIWEIRKHYVEDVYRVLAVYVNGKVDMYKPYPSDLGSKTWKSLPISKFCFCWRFQGNGNVSNDNCQKCAKFQPCGFTRKLSCRHGVYYMESIGSWMQTAASHIFVQSYRCMLKLGLAVLGILFDFSTN